MYRRFRIAFGESLVDGPVKVGLVVPVPDSTSPAALLIDHLGRIEAHLSAIDAKLDGLLGEPVRWRTLDEAAAATGLKRSGIDYHVHVGNLRPVQRDGRLYVTDDQMARLLERPLLRKAGRASEREMRQGERSGEDRPSSMD